MDAIYALGYRIEADTDTERDTRRYDAELEAEHQSELDAEFEEPGDQTPVYMEISTTACCSQDIGEWFSIIEPQVTYKDEVVGRSVAFLIKRECIKPRDGNRKQLFEAMTEESEDLCILFDFPQLFLKEGQIVTDGRKAFISEHVLDSGEREALFPQHEYDRLSDETPPAHPINRAWFLLFREI